MRVNGPPWRRISWVSRFDVIIHMGERPRDKGKQTKTKRDNTTKDKGRKAKDKGRNAKDEDNDSKAKGNDRKAKDCGSKAKDNDRKEILNLHGAFLLFSPEYDHIKGSAGTQHPSCSPQF